MGLELGLGLGLNKGGYRGDPYNDLINLSTWSFDPNQPQGVKGTETEFNTAKVNPLVDRRGVVGVNLLDNGLFLRDTFILNTDGSFSTVTGAQTSYAIPVKPNTYYTVITDDRCEIRFENNLRQRISNITGFNGIAFTFTTPENCAFVYIYYSRNGTNTSQVRMNEGATLLPFEPYGKANVLMTNVAWTNLDGYRVETINGKTNVFFNLDGVDTFGALNSASAPNPTGSDDFWQLVVFRPDDVNVTRYLGVIRNGSLANDVQYGVLHSSDGNTFYYVNGSSRLIQASNTSLKYALFGRINGRRFAIVNSIELNDEINISSITTQPNTQLACRSASADGLNKTAFSKGLQGICAMGVGAQGTIDKAKVVATVAKAMKQIYGLGV